MITNEQHREIEARLDRNRKPKPKCDHKFVDSNHCLKCGWVPPAECAAGVEDEIRDLHRPIIEFCRSKGWIYFYSNTTRKTGRTLGEPDFTILADRSRVIFIECKSRGEDLNPGQAALKCLALYLGHTIHTVYTMDQFYELVK